MLDMVATVDAFVVGFVQAELAEEEARRRTGLTEEQREAEDFPDVDATFERRLALVLDRLAASVERRRPPARSPG
jgi:hypothetical protein